MKSLTFHVTSSLTTVPINGIATTSRTGAMSVLYLCITIIQALSLKTP